MILFHHARFSSRPNLSNVASILILQKHVESLFLSLPCGPITQENAAICCDEKGLGSNAPYWVQVQDRQESNEIAIFTKTGNDAEELQEIAVGKSHLVGRRQNCQIPWRSPLRHVRICGGKDPGNVFWGFLLSAEPFGDGFITSKFSTKLECSPVQAGSSGSVCAKLRHHNNATNRAIGNG